jgi:DNA-binding response OmpR family regulator
MSGSECVGAQRGPKASTDARASVLVLENDPDLAAVLTEALDLMGYAVTVVADREAALDVLHQEDPAVLLVDIGMPMRDGMVLAQITRRWRGAGFPIIAITGWTAPSVHARARAVGCDLILTKPFLLAELRDAIECLRAWALSS